MPPDSEKLLEQSRKELAKVKQMLDQNTLKERSDALQKAKEWEEKEEPFSSPQAALEDQHQFAGYEQDLQNLLQPTWYVKESKYDEYQEEQLPKKIKYARKLSKAKKRSSSKNNKKMKKRKK